MLFIGGPWDGGHKDIEDGLPYCNVAEQPDPNAWSYSERDISIIPAIRIRKYTLRRFLASDIEFRFMADERLSDADAMQRLLSTYRP